LNTFAAPNTTAPSRKNQIGREIMASNALTAIVATSLALLSGQLAMAQDPAPAPGTIKPDGTVVVPSFELPPSIYLSPEALKAMPKAPMDPEAMMFQALKAGKAGEMRARIGEFMKPRHDQLKAMYRVESRAGELAGVPAVWMKPIAGVPSANRKKLLLNLPGGGFVMGTANGTGMVESIPLAGLAGVEIVSITYRQSPEFKYPAATEDVVKVWRELLKTHRAQDMAIFGCSAGGLLTPEAIAAFEKEKLPLPRAIGIFCASADARWGGDSRAFGRPFQALPPREGGRGYFEGADMNDPLVSPIMSSALLSRFPPTLLITATRAMEMSATVNTHRELIKAGVDARLHVWDGLGHAFFYDPALPESREVFDVQAAFFKKQLGLK
jgi:epsilon-lactone hydrolase